MAQGARARCQVAPSEREMREWVAAINKQVDVLVEAHDECQRGLDLTGFTYLLVHQLNGVLNARETAAVAGTTIVRVCRRLHTAHLDSLPIRL